MLKHYEEMQIFKKWSAEIKLLLTKLIKKESEEKDKKNSVPFSVERIRYKASEIIIKIKRLEINKDLQFSWFCLNQKNFCRTHNIETSSEAFDKTTNSTLLRKKRLWHRYFPLKFPKFLITPPGIYFWKRFNRILFSKSRVFESHNSTHNRSIFKYSVIYLL